MTLDRGEWYVLGAKNNFALPMYRNTKTKLTTVIDVATQIKTIDFGGFIQSNFVKLMSHRGQNPRSVVNTYYDYINSLDGESEYGLGIVELGDMRLDKDWRECIDETCSIMGCEEQYYPLRSVLENFIGERQVEVWNISTIPFGDGNDYEGFDLSNNGELMHFWKDTLFKIDQDYYILHIGQVI